MKLRATLAAALIGTAAFAQVDLINKVKDNGADAPLGYEWETVVDIEATPVKNRVLLEPVGRTQPLHLWRAR